ncbi:MAG TPA: SDR family NAD(P)-dependent oxidoreductase [Actinomycetota bacterium]|nr:SDR family NAD(P)-dependent oxidoreductase [Actinomycetota bacterium]
MKVALITGASRGFGAALADALNADGWVLVVDARNGDALATSAARWDNATAVAGDVSDTAHRDDLARTVHRLGRLDLLVNNASLLGPSPQPTLDHYPIGDLRRVYDVNVLAPLALTQLVLPELKAAGGIVVNVTSDAGLETYEGWGGYGSSKAALDQLTAILGAENPSIAAYAFDPGDMRTQMHQEAFPGEDISDRPDPHTIVPALLRLLEAKPKSGRYRAADFVVAA